MRRRVVLAANNNEVKAHVSDCSGDGDCMTPPRIEKATA